MLFDDVRIVAVTGAHGTPLDVHDAVSLGRYDHVDALTSGMLSVAVHDGPAVDLAVQVARRVLDRHHGPITGHVHASALPQGPALWSAPSYVLAHAAPEYAHGFDGLCSSVGAVCNGSLVALDTAARSVVSGAGTYLVTVADCFGAPDSEPSVPVDRFAFDRSVILGDGAAAAIVSSGPGPFRIAAISSFSDPGLELLQRGSEPVTSHVWPPDSRIRSRTREALGSRGCGADEARSRQARGVRRCVDSVLRETGWTAESVRWFVVPFVGDGVLTEGYLRPLGIGPERTLADVGRRLGHLGAADHLYALSYLLERRLVRPRDRVVLVGVGAGFTFTAAAVEAEQSVRVRRRQAHTEGAAESTNRA